MKIFFSHPMRPFFTAAAVSAITAALGFFVLPNAVILHRQIFLEFMLPAAYGGFLFAAMPEWTGCSGSLNGGKGGEQAEQGEVGGVSGQPQQFDAKAE